VNREGRVFLVAEAGVNHNGSVDLALKLIDAAVEAGADAVKFQTFQASLVASRHARKAAYQVATTRCDGNQLSMIKTLMLDEEAHVKLVAHARERRIEFLSTPFDIPSLNLLTERFDLKSIKISSGDITNAPLLVAVGRTGRPAILSTGMSTLAEVEMALGALAFGYGNPNTRPSQEALLSAFASASGQRLLKQNVTLLHCTTEYPAPIESVNLKVIETLKMAFGLPVGFSDHTAGIYIAIAAVARGACLIEKHVTLDRGMEGPDHAASLMPDEFGLLVRAVRDVELSLGDGIKIPAHGELKNRTIARRSPVASIHIAAGETLSGDNVVCKRPANGRSPFEYWDIIGKPAARDYEEDDII
jgi:N-acetylneuraminate synthase